MHVSSPIGSLRQLSGYGVTQAITGLKTGITVQKEAAIKIKRIVHVLPVEGLDAIPNAISSVLKFSTLQILKTSKI